MYLKRVSIQHLTGCVSLKTHYRMSTTGPANSNKTERLHILSDLLQKEGKKRWMDKPRGEGGEQRTGFFPYVLSPDKLPLPPHSPAD
jgi:hypothetical protein